MIERYSREEMSQIWSIQNRWHWMLQVEIAVAEVQAQQKIIPQKAALEIRKRGRFSVERIQELEKTTQHDVIAFVSNVAENVGPWGRYVHFGMTSSDVLDTAFSLQVRQACNLLLSGIHQLEIVLNKRMQKEAPLLCVGRTHGIWAEPTTMGLKWAGFLAELARNKKRIQTAMEQMSIAKLSGAVGTYSGQPPSVEAALAKKLQLQIEPVATQVIPRDRHAQMIQALALLGCGLERCAIELRHLQRSEVDEVREAFRSGQKGSSAMPHKKNPISAENITGLSRLLRSYSQAALENVSLWHERDISHSSVERVIFPDAFIVADYAIHRMKTLIEGLEMNFSSIENNLKRTRGLIYSSQALLSLVEKGLSREQAYALVQRISHEVLAQTPGKIEHPLGKNEISKRKTKGEKKPESVESLEEAFSKDQEIRKWLGTEDLNKIFSGQKNVKYIKDIIKRMQVSPSEVGKN